MIDLVTLQQSKVHLRRTDTDVDVDVEMKIKQASEIVMDYIKLSAVPTTWIDASTSPVTYVIPALIQAATLLVLGELYMNREASVVDVLNDSMGRLLWRYRDPAMA